MSFDKSRAGVTGSAERVCIPMIYGRVFASGKSFTLMPETVIYVDK